MLSRFLALPLFLVPHTLAQTWCNKNYLQGQPVVPPGGQFRTPDLSSEPLLVFRCAPAIRPYLGEEDELAGVVVDAFTTFTRYSGAEPIKLPEFANGSGSKVLDVWISVGGTVLAEATMPLNATQELHFPLALLGQPRKQPFDIECVASYASRTIPEVQIYRTTAAVSYLKRPSSGAVTKRDSRTGALLVKPPGSSSYEAVFPIGFYTSFDNYLDSDLGILDKLKAQGFTIVHPVPTFGDLAALERVLNRMEELGLLFVYDMRHTYRDLAALTAEVSMIKHRPNLLLWYTADEPDGTSDPLDAPRRAYDTIYALDGYHPVALALNCADYEFAAYTTGADVVMPDTYTIANDPAFSAKYNTSCTADFGCCGCDNCRGELEDVARRLDDFAMRMDVLGWAREKTVWAVAAGVRRRGVRSRSFALETYRLIVTLRFWTRPPTGREFAIQVILSVNHGARGIMPWIDPTTADIKDTASALAMALASPMVKGFISSPRARFSRVVANRIDVGMWRVGAETLLLVANLNPHDAELALPLSDALDLREVLVDGVRRTIGAPMLELEGLGYGIFVAYPPSLVFNAQGDEL